MEYEEDFLGEEPIKIMDDGRDTGLRVEPAGGSFKISKNGEVLALRPDKKTAISCAFALAFHVERGGPDA